MPIPRTKLQSARIVEQVQRALLNMQRDMPANAAAHKKMLADGVPFARVQQIVSEAGPAYLKILQWIADLRSDAVRRQALIDALALRGMAETDVTQVYTSLRQAAIALRDAPKTTPAEIVAACDAVLGAVDAPESLWPE